MPPPAHAQIQPRPALRGSNTLAGRDLADRLMVNSDGMLADAHVLNDSHLYVVLGHSLDTDDIPELVRTLVLVMHRTYPSTSIVVDVRDQEREPLVRASFDNTEGKVTYTFPSE